MHHFNGSEGSRPGALVLNGSTLYGAASSGGAFNCGTLFQLSTAGNGFKVLQHFGGPPGDGKGPSTLLLSADGSLYGITWEGGASNMGTVFKIGLDGSNYTVLKAFAGGPNDGRAPTALVVAGTNLYGTTYNGGISNAGSIFQLRTDGTSYSVLRSFIGGMSADTGTSDAAYPNGAIALSGHMLYGSTVGGGLSGNGAIYSFDLDSGTLKILKEGNNSEGCHFVGDMVLSGTTLYGTCYSLSPGLGGIFRLNTDGTGYEVLKMFTGFDGVDPRSLILYGTNLYGTATFGAISNSGVIYEVRLAGRTNYTLKEFLGSEGGNPSSIQRSGPVLYGTAASGGSYNAGVVYAFTLPDPWLSSGPQTQTAELHSRVALSAKLSGASPLNCFWFYNETNLLSISTNSVLEIADAAYSDSGLYTLVVTNSFGAVTSAPAALNVIAPVPRRMIPALGLTGMAGASINIESAEAPGSAWRLLDRVLLSNSFQWHFDVTPVLPQLRYYRVFQSSGQNWVPALSLHTVPALTLTGSVGSTVQIEWINQFGPVDAWVPLASVIITNNSQSYFDSSAIGQPPRLWRIMP